MKRQGVFFVCLLAILAVSVNAAGEKRKKDSRIVNGRPINIYEAPYQVQLRTLSGGFFCGGSLIAPQYVVSAAHCVKTIKPSNIVVVAGVTYTSEQGEQRRIARTFIPGGYNFQNSMSNEDILIFKLDSPMPLNDNIKTIGLCNKPMIPGELATVTGWGAQYSGGKATHQLQSVRVPIIDTKECAQLYSGFAPVYGTMFCAANLRAKQDACQGDSGGPLVVAGKLCGVVSWGRGCARSDSPGVYTSITAEMPFIEWAMSS